MRHQSAIGKHKMMGCIRQDKVKMSNEKLEPTGSIGEATDTKIFLLEK
jgi:hypothetical protein